MPELSELIHHYGYLAILLGTIIEGETVCVLGGIAAHKHWLNLPLAMFCASLGGALGDTIMFMLGRYFGTRLVQRFSKGADGRVHLMQQKIRQHQGMAIFGVRFIYGLRLVGPVVIGASDVSIARFILFNSLGAVTWGMLFVGGGYLFGNLFSHIMGDVEKNLVWLVPVLILVVMGFHWWMERRQTADGDSESRNKGHSD